MDTSKRIENLERSVRRLQRRLLFLAVLLVGCATVAALPHEELMLRKLTIVDADGTVRFVPPERIFHGPGMDKRAIRALRGAYSFVGASCSTS